MSFVSTEFIVFALIVIPLYFATGQSWRWMLLLVASYFFYAQAEASYILLIAFSTLVDYLVALGLERTKQDQLLRRRALLACSVCANLGVLFLFKYANLFSSAAADLANALGMPLQIASLELVLPVGISFYTFQSMAYTIDVYRGRLPAHRRLGVFATYVALFPQLVAGPIERATNMLPQFALKFDFDYDRVVSGLRLALWGFFKKVVIADRLAIYVNEVYGNVEAYTGASLILAATFFTFQVYCDFSGYSDIAIGLARVMGFRLMENFRRPFLATSVSEFWRRWHISLSSWFRDYVYISLGGNRCGLARQLFNVFLVFTLSGLWHGAAWTFAIWGAMHGVAAAIETWFRARKIQLLPDNALCYAIKVVYPGLFLTFSLIVFRSANLEEISYIFRHLFDFSRGLSALTDPFAAGLLPQRLEFTLSFMLIGGLLLIDWIDERHGIEALFGQLALLPRWGIYYALLVSIYVSLFYHTAAQDFIYFQF